MLVVDRRWNLAKVVFGLGYETAMFDGNQVHFLPALVQHFRCPAFSNQVPGAASNSRGPENQLLSFRYDI
jgi:hypothetical protein